MKYTFYYYALSGAKLNSSSYFQFLLLTKTGADLGGG